MQTAILKQNVGPVDRAIRATLGLALVAIAIFGTNAPWGYLGLIPLATALLGSCPLYSVLGISTCPRQGMS